MTIKNDRPLLLTARCLAVRILSNTNKGIMHKISPLVGPLRATPPIIGSEEERARRDYTVQMSKRGLIDLCQQEASKFLVQGRYDLAVPGAIQVTMHIYYLMTDLDTPFVLLLARDQTAVLENSRRRCCNSKLRNSCKSYC